MPGDPIELRKLSRLVIALGVAMAVTGCVLIVTKSPIVGWLVALEAFAFLVAASIYRADSRPDQKHRVK